MAENKRHKIDYKALNFKNFHKYTLVDSEDEGISDYIRDARKFTKIDQEEEQFLISKIKSNDPESDKYKNKLIGSHQPFVIMFAKRHCPYNSDVLLDLIQEGNIGMLMALERYDVTSGVKFMTYANAWILKYMYKFLKDNELVKRSNREKTFGIDSRVREQFIREYGYEPSSEELLLIFNEMGIKLKHKEDLEEIKVISLDQPLNPYAEEDEDDDNMFDVAFEDDTEEKIDRELKCQVVDKIMKALPELERKAMEKLFGFNGGPELDLQTVAESLGMSKYKVEKIYNSAVEKFQKYEKVFE